MNKILRAGIIILAFVSVILLCLYYYSKIDIERYLDKISEDISLNSANDIEKVHKIIAWENNDLGLKDFNRYEILLRYFSNDPHWYIYRKKARCMERAIIFEDMAKRTNITYRKLAVNGFIDPKENRTANHRWSEVWLDNDWRIADSGFDLSYPEDNPSYFTSVTGYLIGHVAIINDNGTFGDCTDRYVNRTGKLIIQAVNDGENIEDADVSVTLIHRNLSCTVVGGEGIKLKTNNSSLCEINLGIYDGTNYLVGLRREGIFSEYFGQENVTIANETNSLVIELEGKIRWWMVALMVALLIEAFLLFVMVNRKIIRKTKGRFT